MTVDEVKELYNLDWVQIINDQLENPVSNFFGGKNTEMAGKFLILARNQQMAGKIMFLEINKNS